MKYEMETFWEKYERDWAKIAILESLNTVNRQSWILLTFRKHPIAYEMLDCYAVFYVISLGGVCWWLTFAQSSENEVCIAGK